MSHQGVHDLFSEQAKKSPGRVAVERGAERVSYAELDERAARLARTLHARGAQKGSPVTILAEDSVEVVTAVIAVLKAGGVFVPLDPLIPDKRLRAMVAEVAPSHFFIERHLLPRFEELVSDTEARPHLLVCGDDYAAGEAAAEMPRVESGPDDMCYVYFTSGSTGRPKGIAGRLKGIDHFVKWEIKTLGLGDDVRVSQLINPSFDASLRDFFVPLCAGGTLCAPPSRDLILDAGRLIEWLDRSRVNVVHCVPTLFRSLLSQQLTPSHFPALKYVLLAGEPLLPADVGRWTEVFGERVQLVNLYGPSETTMTKFAYFVKPSDREARFIPIGKPIEGARALVVDAKGHPCPTGAVGEIYIRTPYRTLGYYRRPDLTAEVFVPNPFSDNPEDIVYRTGDLGRTLDDGNFEFLGRKDSQVKVRGVRVELGEVENTVRGHPSVRDVAVIDREDARGDKYLCAYVVADAGTDTAALREHAARSLPEYLMPSAFVLLDELPRTISGKVDRRALPNPAEARARQGENFLAPRTPVEEAIAAMWRQLLGAQRVSINDSFFELGGHSLLATQLLSKIRDGLGVELSLRALFEAPTVAGLALAVTKRQVEQEDDEDMRRMIEEIKRLSDDALESALGDELEATEQTEAV